MGVPTSYNKLTVRQYIDCWAIQLKYSDKLEKRMALVSHFLKKDADTLPLYLLKYHLERVDKLLTSKINTKIKSNIWIKGKRYKAISDIQHISTTQATMFKELCKDSKANVNVDKLLGLLYYRHRLFKKPVFDSDEWNEVSKQMMSIKAGKVLPIVFFYLNVLERLNQILPYYLMQATETINETMKEIEAQIHGMDLEKDMAGTM